MNKLVIIAQRVDEDDDIVGFFIDWIKEFSKNFDHVSVITQKEGKYNFPVNVSIYSMGKENNYSKIRQLFRLYYYLIKELPGSKGLLVHMSPIFAVIAWPVAIFYRKKIILWYLHRAVSWKLKLANILVFKIVTALKSSLNIKSDKIIELGHGINIDKFVYQAPRYSENIQIISVNRISPIKNLETLIHSVSLLRESGIKANLSVIGSPVLKKDWPYLDKLKKLVQDLDIQDKVNFIGHVPYSQIHDYYRRADLSINLAPRGGLDKVVLESMAMGIPSFTSNEVFTESFGDYADYFIFKYGNENDLSQKIKRFLLLDLELKKKVTEDLRQVIIINHSLSNLIKNISSIL